MELSQIEDSLSKVLGCTFASLDAETKPVPGVRKVTVGESVILFTNTNSSGYQNMVRKRLKEAGRNPDGFIAGDLPWGERVPDSPLIIHHGKYYLQTILLKEGVSKFYIGDKEVSPTDLGIVKRPPSNQGLLQDNAVLVHAYALENIKRLSIMGETHTV